MNDNEIKVTSQSDVEIQIGKFKRTIKYFGNT